MSKSSDIVLMVLDASKVSNYIPYLVALTTILADKFIYLSIIESSNYSLFCLSHVVVVVYVVFSFCFVFCQLVYSMIFVLNSFV